ncbi:MAG: ZIP family metal transporter [Patescibacteria group bacterium]|nr:ZIP family metal transporter [Patescibacteria group bacterium]
MDFYLKSAAAVFLVSVISLIGIVTVGMDQKKLSRVVFWLVSLSVGTLLGGAFFHLIPESLELSGSNTDQTWFGVLGGILLFFILEKIIHWHHCHHLPAGACRLHQIATVNISGDVLHNFIDGILIGGSFLVSPELGVSTTVAIALHELPQEIGDFGILIHAGYSRRKALGYNFLSALSAFMGLFLVFIFRQGAWQVNEYLLSVTAGGFIYIASSDLIPELQKERNFWRSFFQLVCIGIGVWITIKLA